MSRHIASLALIVCLAVLAVPAPFASAQTMAEVKMRNLIHILNQPIATAKFTTPMSLKDALEEFGDIFKMKGTELPTLVNERAFQAQGLEDIYNRQVSLPPVPRKLPFNLVLRRMLQGGASLVIRQGHIEIVPLPAGATDEPLRRTVIGLFEQRPLREALQELSSQTGVTINLDGREEAKGKTAVTAMFRGNVTLYEAATVLADSAGLRLVVMGNSLYVTNPANAERLKKDYEPPHSPRDPA